MPLRRANLATSGDEARHLGDDHVYGAHGDDRLLGGPGDDMLTGSAGVDRIEGGPGDTPGDRTILEHRDHVQVDVFD